MISQFLTTIPHPFYVGLAIGGICFAGPLGIIGWCLGYEAGLRKVGGWLRPKIDEAHGAVPTLPPVRERRLSSVEHRGWLS